MTGVVIELVRNRSDEPPVVNADLVTMLREVLALAESGEVPAAAVAYVHGGMPTVCYEAHGYEPELACAARQIDDELRAVLFSDGGE